MEKNKERQPFFANYPIALFDILGFRDLVKSRKVNNLHNIFKNISTIRKFTTIRYPKSITLIRTKLISDTILIYPTPRIDSNYGVEKFDMVNSLLQAACTLLGVAAYHELPIRGALSYGELYFDSRQDIIMGPALIKAYEIEKQQEWMGAIVDPDHTKLFHESFDRYQWNLTDQKRMLIEYTAPLKKGKRQTFCCLGWYHLISPKHDKNIKNTIMNAFLRGKSETQIDHEVYNKMKNTLDYLAYCKSNDLV